MARDALHSLLRLRRMALDGAQRTLGLCLAQEEAAGQSVIRAEAAIARETGIAEQSSEDGEVEAFAAWLPVGRRARQEAEAARDLAAKETALARAALTLARSAVEAAEDLIERRAVSQRQLAERRAQAVLDEVGLRAASEDRGEEEGPRAAPERP